MPETNEPRDSSEDEELRNLLDELEKEDCPVDSIPQMKKKSTSKKKDDIAVQPLQRQESQQRLIFDKPTGEITEVFQGQFQDLISRYTKITDEILRNYERDRDQAQEVLDHFLNTLSTGGKIPRIYVEKIAEVLKSKNDIAQTPIKMLDTITRFVSASKGNDALNQMNVSFDTQHLAKLLEAKGYDDEGESS
jgi:hypothetical protein